MWIPFGKHKEEHYDLQWAVTELTVALSELNESVIELRQEVDYLADFLDD
jgi:hypothetical protein